MKLLTNFEQNTSLVMERQSQGRERVGYLDIAKGIAIICIVLGHLGIPAINRVVFTFHVPIFYFITIGSTIIVKLKGIMGQFSKQK